MVGVEQHVVDDLDGVGVAQLAHAGAPPGPTW